MSSINAPPPRYSDVSHSSVYSNNSDLDPNEKIKLYDNQAERRKVSEQISKTRNQIQKFRIHLLIDLQVYRGSSMAIKLSFTNPF